MTSLTGDALAMSVDPSITMDIAALVTVRAEQAILVVDADSQEAPGRQVIFRLMAIDTLEPEFAHMDVDLRVGKQ